MDLIDRQDAIEHIKKRLYESAENNIGLMCMADHVFTEIADNRINTWIEELPSAQTKGKWIWVQYDSISELGNWYCSECGFMPAAFNLAKKHLNYCPNCGSDMRGEEE